MAENGCFMRVGSSSLPMSQNMIDDLYSKRIHRSLRNIISPRQNLSFSQLKIYYQEKGLELNDHFAESLELLIPEGKYNYLAYLLADENGISIKITKYAGDTKVDLIENEEYGYCSLLKATHLVLDKLRIENITKAQITDRTRIEKNLVDTVALREAVINAIVHNDYITEYPPVFEIFSNRITVTSFGGLIHNQTLEEFFSGGSMPRNRELMRVFKDIGLVEQLGSGMDRILKIYERSIFNISPHIIKVEFPINSVPKGLTETQLKILHLIINDTMISQRAIANELNMTVSGVKRAMKRMQEINIIKRYGSNRKGKWIVLEKE